MAPPAGWFPDPEYPGQLRYFDGVQWTENRTPAEPVVVAQAVAPPVSMHHTKPPWYARPKPWIVLGVCILLIPVLLVVLVFILGAVVRDEFDSTTDQVSLSQLTDVAAGLSQRDSVGL